MKNTKKNYSHTLRQRLREGFILYAAATSCFPVNVDLLKLYCQEINGEEN